MHRAFTAAALGLLASMGVPALAQSAGNAPIWVQQQNLQNLLNSAVVALRSDDQASACQLRSQALGILSTNFEAFAAAYPSNNWSDLQTSLQGSVNKCTARGL